MISGFEVYSFYVAIKAHFNGKFDFHKYKGAVKVSMTAYEKRKDRSFFERIGSKYTSKNIIDLFVANFVERPNSWIGDFLDEEAEQIYLDWQRRVQSLTYNYREDIENIQKFLDDRNLDFAKLFEVKGSDHPLIVKMLAQRKIELESFIILDSLNNLCVEYDEKLKNDPFWEKLSLKIKKYKPFLHLDLQKIIKQVV